MFEILPVNEFVKLIYPSLKKRNQIDSLVATSLTI